MPYFDASHLPKEKNEYVAWIDIMGIQEKMSRSVNECANFIFKIHLAASKSKPDDLILYPIMDGLYASSQKKDSMTKFLGKLFLNISNEFISENNNFHKFMIRCGLAFGPTIHGRNVNDSAFSEVKLNDDYKNSLMLGIAMIHANQVERNAPPFGIFIHDSARSFHSDGEESFRRSWHIWGKNEKDWEKLGNNVVDYLNFCEKHALAIGYDSERVSAHKEMAKQYFSTDMFPTRKSSPSTP